MFVAVSNVNIMNTYQISFYHMNPGKKIKEYTVDISFNILLNMMKEIVVLTFCGVAIFAAPARDEDERVLENHNIGDYNGIEDHLSAQPRVESDFQLSSAIPTIEEIKEINQICKEETKIDKKIVEMVLIHQIIPTDPIYRKFLACSYRKQKYLNGKGEIQFQKIVSFLSQYYKKEDLKVLEVCGQLKQSSNAGDNAYNVLKCLLPKLSSLQEIFDE